MSDPILEGPQDLSPEKRPPEKSLEVAQTLLSAEDHVFLDRLNDQHRLYLDHATYVLSHSKTTIKTGVTAYQNFRQFLLSRGAERQPSPLAVKVHHLDAWVGWNRRRGLSAITTNTYWRALRPFFNYLEKNDGFTNPYHGAKAPAFQLPLPKALRAEDLLRILSSARNYPWNSALQRERAIALFGTMIYAGLRRSEILKLEFADVNLQEGTLLIRRGKGRAGGKDRMGYICPELRVILHDYVQERQRRNFTCPEFFVSRENRGISVEQLKRIHLQVRRASGIDFSMHSLRHSFVTMLLRSGVPINVVQALAGHTSITTTAGYMRVWDDDLRTQINKFRLK
jgi:site-specific recombinase XerD